MQTERNYSLAKSLRQTLKEAWLNSSASCHIPGPAMAVLIHLRCIQVASHR
jgi:hypothetical protein